MNNELVGLLVGLVLTLFIYSYVLGDNPLYRLAIHILVGASAAYAAVVLLRQVFLPIYAQLWLNPDDPGSLMWLIPLLLGLLLLVKRLPAASWMGRGTMAFMIGIGAAVALLGALRGTLLPQVTAVSNDSPLINLMIAFLTIATLSTFQFTGSKDVDGNWTRPAWQRLLGLAPIGQAVLMITFGALFAAVLNTSLILLIERINYFINEIAQIAS